ncbi:fibronectin type-III domain-containing protein 3A [Nematostella vectensis]|uniref:fibronectin type-III domain-containing protein 3A n=1 Tax=Nematostella vectensis TaxID=45351 RepID=UPI0013900D37|nr:fibronectin type-III domain-containing protein 3A [Nematostella vectensis]
MSNDLKTSANGEEEEGRRVDLHTTSGETICLSFPVNENPLPKIIQLVDPDTGQTMLFPLDKNGVYNEVVENSERILNEVDASQHCQHCSCVHDEANGTSEFQRQSSDERLEKRREKLQKKLREKKGSVGEDGCSGHCHQMIQIPVQGLDHIRNSFSCDDESGDNSINHEQNKIDDLKIHKSPEVEIISSTCAKISWSAQVSNNSHLSGCKFELQSAAKNGGFKNIYSGTSMEHKETNLRPGTAYKFRLCAVKDKIRGEYSPEASAQTPCDVPSTPIPPHLANKTKTGFNIKWAAPSDNGSPITGYKLEWDEGLGDGTYTEIYYGPNRQYKLTHKLPPGTKCIFRVQAINEIGVSGFSKDLTTFTIAGVPDAPQAPILDRAGVAYLIISWNRPQCNGAEITEYLLEMEDESTGYGFMVRYRGPEQRAKVENLKRHSSYKFRVSAINCQGSGKWSETSVFTTVPERPARPFPPALQGKAKTSSFAVTWDPPGDTGGTPISKFVLEMDDGKGGPFKEVYGGMETERSFDGLLPGHHYRMRLACYSEGGISEWSRVVKLRTIPVCPGQANPPVLSKLHKALPNALHLNWDPPEYTGGAFISGYILEMEMEKLGVKEFREIYHGADHMCAVSGLQPGKAYSFRVRAVNEAGAGKVSRIAELSTAPGVPDAPRAPDTVCRSAAAIQITWEPPSTNGTPVTGYTLEYMDEGTFTELYTGTDLSYELRKGLLPANYYYFRLKALSAVGASLWSQVSTCQTPAASPAAVSSVRCVDQSSSHLRLRWKHPADNGAQITSYNIEIAGARNICYDVTGENEAGEEPPRVQEYDITDLQPSTAYRIRVQAVNKIGCGPFSPVIIASTRDLPPPAPTLEVAIASYQSLKLRWGSPGGKDNMGVTYTLEMADELGNFQTIFNGATTSHKVGKLRERTEYDFRIQASNEAGTGSYSDVFTFMTTAQPPGAIKGLRAESVTASSFTVCWEPVQSVKRGDSVEYLLQRQHVGKDQDFVWAYQGSDTRFAYTSLPTGSEYRFRVCAVRHIAGGDFDATDSPSRGLKGVFSPVVSVRTQSMRRHRVSESSSRGDEDEEEVEVEERKSLTDTQWALIFFIGFALLSLGFAFVVPLLFGVSE